MKTHLMLTSFALVLLISVHPVVAKDSSGTGPQQPFQTPCCSVGDVTGDDAVTQEDVDAIIDHIIAVSPLSPEQAYNADVTGNRAVDIHDLFWVHQFVIGAIETFPKCGDLDRDGFLEFDIGNPADQEDALILSHHIFGSAKITEFIVLENADANNDCTHDDVDLNAWFQLEIGLHHSFPGCTYDPEPCEDYDC